MTKRLYTARCVREGNNWLAEVEELPGAHTWARNLKDLERNVREAIVLAADLPEDQIDSFLLQLVWGTPRAESQQGSGDQN